MGNWRRLQRFAFLGVPALASVAEPTFWPEGKTVELQSPRRQSLRIYGTGAPVGGCAAIDSIGLRAVLVVLSACIPPFGPSRLACTWPAEEARGSDGAVNGPIPGKHKIGRFRIAALKQARSGRKAGEHRRRVTSDAVGV